MFGNNEVSVSELEPRKAPEPMPYIEPPCKPKVPEVSLLINNAPVGNARHPVSEESYNAWKRRQNNMIETHNNGPMHHSLKQLDPSLHNTMRACYSAAGKEQDMRYRTVTENWHTSNFSPGTQLYTPIGESTPLQGILRNSGRNAVVYDKMSHRVSYQPAGNCQPLPDACSKPSNSHTSHRSYTANQENVISHRRVPVPHNQLQAPQYDQDVNQRQWELKETQYGDMHRNQIPPSSYCGSHNYRNVVSGDICKNQLNTCSNEQDPRCNRVSANLTKPQGCCDNAPRNYSTHMEVHKISASKTPKNRVKETLEPQPEILAALFRLVCMQSEQLQQLKEQVQKLVEKLETSSSQPAKVCTQSVAVQSENVCSCYQEKVSVGVMTEEQDVAAAANRFEQQQQQPANSSCQCCQKSNPAVDETINFSSMQLETVHEPALSPMTTMHVDMHDYQSDEEHGEANGRPSPWCGNDRRRKEQQQQAEDGDRIHWTFYSNVMQQMNKLMDEKGPASNTAEDTQKKIQRATFKELVHMGVSICDAASAVGDQSLLYDPRLNNEVADSEPRPNINPEALKYLDEQLRQTDAGNKRDLTLFLKTTNLSFTAMRYLQQNHGLPLFTEAGKGPQVQRSPPVHHEHQCCYSHDAPPSKVLDITMLKQQPKLL